MNKNVQHKKPKKPSKDEIEKAIKKKSNQVHKPILK